MSVDKLPKMTGIEGRPQAWVQLMNNRRAKEIEMIASDAQSVISNFPQLREYVEDAHVAMATIRDAKYWASRPMARMSFGKFYRELFARAVECYHSLSADKIDMNQRYGRAAILLTFGPDGAARDLLTEEEAEEINSLEVTPEFLNSMPQHRMDNWMALIRIPKFQEKYKGKFLLAIRQAKEESKTQKTVCDTSNKSVTGPHPSA